MSSPLGGSTDAVPAKHTFEPSFPNEPAVTLATFRFKTIGQPPALLQRMSASARSAENSQNSNTDSRSPSLDLEDDLLFPESSPDVFNSGRPLTNAQPSLRARITLSEPLIEESGAMDVDTRNPMQKEDSFAVDSRLHNNESYHKPSPAENPSLSKLPQSTTNTTSSWNMNEHRLYPAETTFSGSSSFSGPSSIQRVSSINQTVIHLANPVETSTFSESSTLKSLRDLQSLLSQDLNSPSTGIFDAIRLGQTIKDQCILVLSACRNAHDLAHQSITSARESLEASLKSLAVAESLQTRADELMASVTRINSERDDGWRNAIAPFATRLSQLVKDVNDQEKSNVQARRLNERNRKVSETEANIEAPGQSSNPPIHNPVSHTGAEDALSRIECEATIASEDLIRNREEAEVRQRAAEEALRQRREAEDLLEQQRQRAQAELELLEEKFKQAQTERLEAEEKERLRQEEEMRIIKIKEEEKKLKEEQAMRLALEERNKRAAVELQKQQALQRDKLAREAALRERLEKEKFAREQDAVSLMAKEDEKEQLRQQEFQHQEIRDQKIRATLEAAKKIQTIKAQNIPTPESSSSNHHSKTVLFSPSVSILSGVSNTHPESGPSLSGGNVMTSAQYRTPSLEAKSLPRSNAFAINSQLPHQAESVSGDTGKAFKSRSSIGLPSPPLEEHKTSGGHLTNDRPRSIVDLASEVQRPHEAAVKVQSHQHTVQPKRSTSPYKQSRYSQAVELETIDVESGTKKSPSSTPSQTSPNSPTACKLSFLKPIIKTEPDESKIDDTKPSSLKVEVEPTPDYKPTVKTETYDKKLTFNSPSECHIPPLSMPSPPAHSTRNEGSPTLQMPDRVKPTQRFPFNKRHILDPVEESSSASRTVLPLPGRNHDRIIPAKTACQDAQMPDMFSPLPSQSNQDLHVVSSSLPAKLPPTEPLSHLHANNGVNAGTSVDDFGDDQMGPDAAVADGMIPPVHPPLIENDQSRSRHRRVAPRVDHYSPSPSLPLNSNSRGVPARPRRGDHYSPQRRSPVPRGTYNSSRTSPGPLRDRQWDPDNEANTRGLSPGPPAPYRAHRPMRHSPSPEGGAQFSRKRNRETQDAVGPPTNRPRRVYADNAYPQARGDLNVAGSQQQYEDDWSRTANYGRSPSPEPRSTSLFNRLDEAPHTVRLPIQRADVKGYPDYPRRRDAGSSYTHPASSSSEIKSNSPHNAQRQNMGDRPDSSRPHLLDRFTDLPLGGLPSIPEPSQHSAYNKGPRPRKPPYQRPNIPQHQQPLEQRLNSKNSLMSRLQ